MQKTNEKSFTSVNSAGKLTNDARKAFPPIYSLPEVRAVQSTLLSTLNA